MQGLTPEQAKHEVEKAISTLNKAIVKALKAGVRADISILGESEEWPEFQIDQWVDFPESERCKD